MLARATAYVGDRFNELIHVVSDSPDRIINYNATHNAVIRKREQDTVNQIYYPRQIQLRSHKEQHFQIYSRITIIR